MHENAVEDTPINEKLTPGLSISTWPDQQLRAGCAHLIDDL